MQPTIQRRTDFPVKRLAGSKRAKELLSTARSGLAGGPSKAFSLGTTRLAERGANPSLRDQGEACSTDRQSKEGGTVQRQRRWRLRFHLRRSEKRDGGGAQVGEQMGPRNLQITVCHPGENHTHQHQENQ